MTALSRRRFLTISAACAALPVGVQAAPVAHWRGVAMGAPASLRLEGWSPARAAPVIAAVEAELTRLEDIFSLYRPHSQLSRLNRTGLLQAPAPELLQVLSLCAALHEATEGAFDPTVQPVWQALAEGARPDALGRAQAAVGWQKVEVSTSEVRLSAPSALTLNGIAQGAITDRIAALLRSYGLRDVLVDMGEIAALGHRSDGQQWRVGLAGPGGIESRIRLTDRAVATSALRGTELPDASGHILHPKGAQPLHSACSVSAPEAAVADGLSTAICLLETSQIDRAVARFPDARIEMLV